MSWLWRFMHSSKGVMVLTMLFVMSIMVNFVVSLRLHLMVNLLVNFVSLNSRDSNRRSLNNRFRSLEKRRGGKKTMFSEENFQPAGL
jgi:hypothetical protein